MIKRNSRQVLFLISLIILSTYSFGQIPEVTPVINPKTISAIRPVIPTFLGNEQRNYYGNEAPSELNIIWKLYLGKGETIISRKLGSRIWAGAGWTGQPLLVEEDTALFIIQGAYDHNLKKINAQNGKLVWQYKYDDVIKGTGTLWDNIYSGDLKNRLVILQGSRLGVGNYLDTKHIPSYRAISYFTGEELWRLDVKWTDSYSRDVDGSALVINDTAYLGLENSLFTVFDPDYNNAVLKDGMLQPKIFQETKLYEKKDAVFHKNNIVTESSPSLIDGIIYIASGSGHVYGYEISSKKLVWDFYIGSDIDGSAVVTKDKCILVSVEKQYIKGNGGVFKLDPSKAPENAVVWYLPTGDKKFSSWEGGVIGSAGISDSYVDQNGPYLAAVSAIDGYLYIVNHTSVNKDSLVFGPDSITKYPVPEIVFKKYTGPSISTPIIVGNKIISGGYNGLYLFEYDQNLNISLLAKLPVPFESTPIVHNRKIYVASRNGYFYCLGDKL
ncbi:MAG: hypothetical protein JXJ22_12615 [Bacteroidales bacterium]|nr:hypothetical protein [Bacteroidales bacterium]